MKRFAVITAAALLLVALAVVPAQAAWYYFQVQDEQGRPITSGFVAQVYTTNSQAHDVVFGQPGMTSQKTNPINPDSNGVITFATAATTVDVVVWGLTGNAQGAVARVKAITDKEHRVILNTQNAEKHLRFFWDRDISKGAAVDTGIDLPIGAVVFDAFVEIATGGNTAGGGPATSVSVGVLSTEASGDTDGFCRSVGAEANPQGGATKYWRCEASRTTRTAVDGLQGGEWFFWSSNTRGVLLASFGAGQLSYALLGTGASVGTYAEYPHMVQEGAAKSLVYMTNDRAAAAGYIHLFYRELRVR